MKTLIAYYSSGGNNQTLANEIASRLSSDVEEIRDSRKRSSPLWIMLSVFETFLKIKPGIKANLKNPADYDLVILCAPVWAAGFASPMRTYIGNNKTKFNKVAFACISGGGKNPTLAGSVEKAVGKKLSAFIDLAVIPPGGEKPKDIMSFRLKTEDLKQEYYNHAINGFIEKLSA